METSVGTPAERFMNSQPTVTLPISMDIWNATKAMTEQNPNPTASPTTGHERCMMGFRVRVRASMKIAAQQIIQKTTADELHRLRSAILETDPRRPNETAPSMQKNKPRLMVF